MKERLLREEKLSMARASKASKEQIKVMGPKEQNIENPTVNEIQAGGGRQEKILHVDRDQVWAHTKESARFVRDFGGKTIHAVAESEGSDNEADLLTFSVESSNECLSQDDWHVSLKIADTSVNFKLDSGADCNVISKSLFTRLQVSPTQTRQCKTKLKVYDGR